MDEFRVTEPAQRELQDIRDYISRDSPRHAAKMMDRFEERFAMLARQPFIGEPWDEVRKGMRMCPVGNYVVLYDVGEGFVRILRVLHGARDVESILRSWIP